MLEIFIWRMASITKKWFFSFFICCISTVVFSQTIINGATVYSAPTALIKINNDSLLLENDAYFYQQGLLIIDKDLYINSGKKEIDGTVQINQNLVINDSLIGLSNSSLIELKGNWTNNNTFLPGNNTTVLNGTIQEITGSSNTTYYNLQTQGSISDKKELVGVDVNILNTLDLTNVELSTLTNTLSIINPINSSILRGDGFVSSEGLGRLARNTNSTQEYLFPLGSSNSTLRYRPISIKPNSTSLLTYGARLANIDPNTDFYNTSFLNDSICDVNRLFFHKIYGSNAADLSFYFIPEEDGNWNTTAHWQNNLWNKMSPESLTNNLGFSVIKTSFWNNFNSENFALALKTPNIILDDEIIAYQNEEIEITPYYNGPTAYEINWFPEEELYCSDCIETSLTATNMGYYTLEISATENCIISDSVLLSIKPSEIYFPTGFSPNGDGINDYFIPMNDNLENYHIKIYNRWGEKIFESTDETQGWNGSYKNQNVEIGVYSYTANYKIKNQDENKTTKGSFTLIR